MVGWPCLIYIHIQSGEHGIMHMYAHVNGTSNGEVIPKWMTQCEKHSTVRSSETEFLIAAQPINHL